MGKNRGIKMYHVQVQFPYEEYDLYVYLKYTNIFNYIRKRNNLSHLVVLWTLEILT